LAKLMADFLRQTGVPAEDIIMEGKSRNTYENLAEVRKLVGSSPFILVTSACDQPRAVGVARKLQMNPLPAPACIWALQHYPAKMSVAQFGECLFHWVRLSLNDSACTPFNGPIMSTSLRFGIGC